MLKKDYEDYTREGEKDLFYFFKTPVDRIA